MCVDLAGRVGTATGEPNGFGERDGRRWFVSSDMGAWRTASGTLEILGRADNAITSGGATVVPEAVEAALRELPGVADALVVGLADAEWGQAVTALVVPRDGWVPELEKLRLHVKRRLGREAAPRRLVAVAALPELAPGKPDRRAAAALAEQILPGG
jgi:O-succinylbenzoic acid--CoA ligase